MADNTEAILKPDALLATWALVEQLREGGWLVTLKAMPDGFPFLDGDDYQYRIDRRYVCTLMWVPQADLANTRRRINMHPFGCGDTPLAAVRMARERADEEAALYPVTREAGR